MATKVRPRDDQLTQDFDSFFNENPDDYSEFLSEVNQAFADIGGVEGCLESFRDQIDLLEGPNSDQSRFQVSFSALHRILREPSPSRTELRAAVAIAIEISAQLVVIIGSKAQTLNELHDSSVRVRDIIEGLESKMQAYRRKSGGSKSGITRSRQKGEDLRSAALAYIKLSDDFSVLNPALKDVANQLDRDHTHIAYPAKGGWTQRVKDLTLKAIVSHAKIISRE